MCRGKSGVFGHLLRRSGDRDTKVSGESREF